MGSVINRIRSCLEKNYFLDLKLYYVKVCFFIFFTLKKSKTIRSWSLRHFRFWLFFGRFGLFFGRFWSFLGRFWDVFSDNFCQGKIGPIDVSKTNV